MSESSLGTTLTITVEDPLCGERLDLFLVRNFPDYSRTLIQNQISKGFVKVNQDIITKAKTPVEEGQVITIVIPPIKDPKAVLPQNIPLDIIYEDKVLLVINKPAGLIVHPGDGNSEGTIVNSLLFHYPDLYQNDLWSDPTRAGIVHRLDKDTSGLLIIAKTVEVAKKLQKSFKNRETEKFYYALIHGHLPYTQGRIENYLSRHPTQRQKRAVVSPDAPNAKLAISIYRVMSEVKLASLVRINIETGRTHQIRVHMAHSRCPVIGDPLYGGVRPQIPNCPKQQMLHAWKLSFPHPETKEMLTFTSPIPDNFMELALRLGLEIPREIKK